MGEHDFLRRILDDPAGATATWLVYADWLEERGYDRKAFRQRFFAAGQAEKSIAVGRGRG